SVGELYFRTLGELDRTLGAYRGQAVSFHCEDPVLLDRHRWAATHEARRPAECELSATRFALEMIAKHGLTGKLCHYSVGEGPAAPRAAGRPGRPGPGGAPPPPLLFRPSPPPRAPPPREADDPASARPGRPRGHAGGAARRHGRLPGDRPRPAHAGGESPRRL